MKHCIIVFFSNVNEWRWFDDPNEPSGKANTLQDCLNDAREHGFEPADDTVMREDDYQDWLHQMKMQSQNF